MEENVNNTQSNSLVLKNKTDELVDNIIGEDDVDRTKEMINLFNVNLIKRNVARVNKLNNLLDMVNDQAIKRFEVRPDDVSNKELLDYMSVVQTQIEKSSTFMKSIEEAPPIQLNQQNVTVNIGDNSRSLPRESREKILNAIQSIVKDAKKETEIINADTQQIEENDNIIDAEVTKV